MNRVLETNLVAMQYSRFFVNAMFEAIPEEQYLHQPCPGANHALWILGHLPVVDMFLMQIAGGPVDERLEQLSGVLGMQSTPSANADDYPPIAELRAMFHETRETVLDWYRTQNEEELAKPLPEQFQMIASDRLSLAARWAVHESGHAGQLTVIRKSLGLKPVFA